MSKAMAAALALALVAAGCGSDDEEKSGSAQRPAKLAMELSGSGKQLRFTVPKSVRGGLVSITFTNSTKEDASAQLVGAAEGHTAEEALQAGAAWGEEGKPLPAWVELVGGTGTVQPGESSTVTQQLPAGDYVVADLDSNTTAPLKVSGRGASGEPRAAGRIAASEYRFTPTGLRAGSQRIVFDNTGAEPHFIAAAPIKAGKTIADVRKYVSTEESEGEPPIDEEGGFSTAVVDGKVKQAIQVDLKPGKYALLCFVPDRKGGPPHVAKGMVSEATVR